jgi:RND family efflux transporter MFP subunit
MIRLLFTASLLFTLWGCKKPVTGPTPEPPRVTVAHPIQKDVQLFFEFTGRTQAVERVEIRARVQGFLEKVLFKDSDDIAKDQLLFVIEQPPFQAVLNSALARLESNQAAWELAQANIVRGRQLIQKRAISQQELDVMIAELSQAKAAISGAKAQVEEAQIQLDYTSIHAPIEGRIDRNLVDVGNLVGGMQKTLLANIVRLDPIHAYFDLDERTYLAILDQRGGTRKKDADHRSPVFLGRQNDQDYPFAGIIDFIDNEIDPSTGTILVRGIFPNPDLKLDPGLFVRLRVPKKIRPDAVLVEEQAIGTDMSGKYVLVIGKDDLVELRRVELGPSEDNLRVVQAGLTAADTYIVEGTQRARPGLPVRAEEMAVPTTQQIEGQQIEGQQIEGQQIEGQQIEGQQIEGQQIEGQKPNLQENAPETSTQESPSPAETTVPRR